MPVAVITHPEDSADTYRMCPGKHFGTAPPKLVCYLHPVTGKADFSGSAQPLSVIPFATRGVKMYARSP
jgi:hypothetical protein